MRASQKKERDIANCEMVFDGQRLNQALLSLATSASVDLAIGKPGMFTLEMEGYDEKQGFTWLENSAFAPGTTVEVKMGNRDSLGTLFYGEVVGLDASFSSSGPPRMSVRAYDLCHRLTRGEKRRAFSNLKYSDVARQLASEAGLTPRVTDSGDTRAYIEQKGQSDLAFLLKLAEEIHYHLFAVRKEMVFEPVSNNARASLKMSLDDELTDFHPNLSLAQQVSEVMVRGWDAQKREEIIGRAQAGQESTTMGGKKSASKLSKDTFDRSGKEIKIISNHPVMTQSEADKLAQARLNGMSLDLIEASGTAMGRADLLPGKVVEIAGVSNWFSGHYYLTNTTHRYDYGSGYTTSFGARRNAL
jgi:uncharacterized protein